jgi:ribosomal protein S18 acetylase RimI-like enzyme
VGQEQLVGADVLDNPAWAAMTGPQAHLARIHGQAGRFQDGISPFAGLADPDDLQSWRDLATLVEPGGTVALIGAIEVPEGWEVVAVIDGVQLVDTALKAEPDPEALTLTSDDVVEMLDLVSRTRPGPFLPRTIELGTYLGIRREGLLVAMAGERLRPGGWTEISAVCTDEAYRGQGLATRLVRAIAAGIRARGETPFLHAAASNANAIRLYESIGFTLRGRPQFTVLRTLATLR